MRLAAAAAALALAAAAARAQSAADLPACAVSCLNDAVTQSTTCAVDDFACICGDFSAIQGVATGCILAACGADVAVSACSRTPPAAARCPC